VACVFFDTMSKCFDIEALANKKDPKKYFCLRWFFRLHIERQVNFIAPSV